MIAKVLFGAVVVILVVAALWPTVTAWGKKAKEYFLDSFK